MILMFCPYFDTLSEANGKKPDWCLREKKRLPRSSAPGWLHSYARFIRTTRDSCNHLIDNEIRENAPSVTLQELSYTTIRSDRVTILLGAKPRIMHA